MPASDCIGFATCVHCMLNPNAELHAVGPLLVIARTCAYSAYGEPVNHGSARSIDAAGTRSGGMLVATAGSTVPADDDALDDDGELVPWIVTSPCDVFTGTEPH